MLAAGFSTKQIAKVDGISSAAISERRNRMAKRFGINPGLLTVWAYLRVQAAEAAGEKV
jgi:hypothetical protein